MDGGGYIYSSGPIKERLGAHTHTQEFLNDFTVYVGGSLHPDHGGNWERMARANKWLAQREEESPKPDVRRLQAHIEEMPFDQRCLIEGFAQAAGVERTWRFPSLTTGELRFYRKLAEWIAMSEADDIIDCITVAFPGAQLVPDQTGPDESSGAGGEPEPPVSSKPKVVRVIEDDLLVPPGYLDNTDLSGSTSEIKARINTYLHAHLLAEIDGKNRKGVVDWLMNKLKGFKVPEEMRKEGSSE